jgi:UPF0755 protein
MKRLPLLLFVLLLAGAVCLCLSSGYIGLIQIPARAAQLYGPPSAALGPLEKIYLSAQLLSQKSSLTTPLGPSAAPRPFQVQSGETTATITRRLQAEGFIRDAEALRNYLVYTGLHTRVQAGDYRLSPRMTPLEIAHALQDATPSEVTFRILPGWRREEIAASLPTSGLSFTPQAFLDATAAPVLPAPLADQLPGGASLEGLLFPDQYRLPREIGVEDFIQTILTNFQIKVSADLLQGFEQQGLTLYEAVILASIVQREAVVEEEMPLIASVFLNRLQASMKLDSDPTVQYSLALADPPPGGDWWKSPLSLDDLQIDTPYNTYLHPGLPPSPIASPGLSALRAVAFPAQSSYFYFRAACDDSGKHNFAETYEGHQGNACP